MTSERITEIFLRHIEKPTLMSGWERIHTATRVCIDEGWLEGRESQLASVCEDLEALLRGGPAFVAVDGELGERYQELRKRIAILVQIASAAEELAHKGTQMALAARAVVDSALKGRK